MNPHQIKTWKDQALEEVFIAIASEPSLRDVLIFKGARILNQLLSTERVSLDLDTNLSAEFALEIKDPDQQAITLKEGLEKALHGHFARQTLVRFKVSSVSVVPKKPHPRGWHAHVANIKLHDAMYTNVLGMPSLEIDISAPEKLSEHAVHKLPISTYSVNAYTLERIAGEKLRAFLSTLPAYRAKIRKPGEAVRVKDLYDLTRIFRARSTRDEGFWRKAGIDFRYACESRFIDCSGIDTFLQNWERIQKTFDTDPTLPKNVTFQEVEETLRDIVAFLEREGVIPFEFPLPASTT